MDNTTINGIPVEFGNSNEPIMEIHFMDTTECHPTFYPWNHEVACYNNFSIHRFNNSNVVAFITEKLPLHPSTKKIVVSYHSP